MGINVLIQGAYTTESFSANMTMDSCTNKTSKVTNGELYMFKKFENKTVNIHTYACQPETEHNLVVTVNGRYPKHS